MGQFASRIHSKEDGKVYNILPLGDMPTVVFGRVIKPNSVPGMQYYFPDGRVKWHVKDSADPFEHVTPYGDHEHWGTPCIFTVPEDFDYSKLLDVEYVKQYCRKAQNLNAKTTSPYYLIIDGHIKRIKPLESPGRYAVVVTKNLKKTYFEDTDIYLKTTSTCGEVRSRGARFSDFLRDNDGLVKQIHNKPNDFVLIPVGRVKYKKKYKKSEKTRIKYNITGERHHFKRFAAWFDLYEGQGCVWKIREM